MTTSNKIMTPLHDWLTEYLPNVEGLKPRTIESYKDSWRLVTKYFLNKGVNAYEITYDMLTLQELMGFLGWLENDRKCSASTRANRQAAISKFANYAVNRDFGEACGFYQAVGRLPYKKVAPEDRAEWTYFTHEELKVFLNQPTPKSSTGIRDHALLQFMYATGERAEEVCQTKVKDISFLDDGRAMVEVHGKGGKPRKIKIMKEAASVLKKYIRYRRIGNQPESYVFPSQRNERMSVKCVEEIFKKHLATARSERPDLFQKHTYTPHSMRHTTAMHMVDAGVPIIVIKVFLGHSSISTTEIYAKMNPEKANERIKEWSKDYWSEYTDKSFDSCDIDDDEIPGFLK